MRKNNLTGPIALVLGSEGAILVSVLSGYIPANRATRLSAQEAIRSVG